MDQGQAPLWNLKARQFQDPETDSTPAPQTNGLIEFTIILTVNELI